MPTIEKILSINYNGFSPETHRIVEEQIRESYLVAGPMNSSAHEAAASLVISLI